MSELLWPLVALVAVVLAYRAFMARVAAAEALRKLADAAEASARRSEAAAVSAKDFAVATEAGLTTQLNALRVWLQRIDNRTGGEGMDVLNRVAPPKR